MCVGTIHLESIFVGSMYTLRLTTLHVCNNNLQRKKEYQLESWGYGRGLRERLLKSVGERKEGENSDTILFQSKRYWNISV